MTKSHKPSKNLKKLLDGKDPGRLLPYIEKWMAEREPDFRDYSYLHPSDLIKDGWCQREAWFQLSGHKKPSGKMPFSRANMFNEGHLIHAKWQKYFTEMGVLYGTWKDPEGVPQWGIGTVDQEYCEVPLQVPELMIRGKADGWIKGLGADCLIELKSVGIGSVRFEAPHILSACGNDIDKIWDAIKEPFPSHIRQGQLYLHLAQMMVDAGALESCPKEIVYIYEYKPSQVVKEFVVQYFPSASSRFINKAKRVVEALGGDPLPCSHGDSCSACEAYSLENI